MTQLAVEMEVTRRGGLSLKVHRPKKESLAMELQVNIFVGARPIIIAILR